VDQKIIVRENIVKKWEDIKIILNLIGDKEVGLWHTLR
jgi:hypothetical protein